MFKEKSEPPAVRGEKMSKRSSHYIINQSGLNHAYPVIIYVVANPVRGLLDMKRSEEHHLQSSNESIKNQNKTKTC